MKTNKCAMRTISRVSYYRIWRTKRNVDIYAAEYAKGGYKLYISTKVERSNMPLICQKWHVKNCPHF